MAELSTLARPYAEAVMQLASAEGNFDAWSNTLNFLADVMRDIEIAAVIANPRVSKETLSNIILDVCESGELGSMGVNLVKLLLKNGRLQAIPHIATQYAKLKAQQQGFINVELISAYETSVEQQHALETALQNRFGKKVNMSLFINPSLLGGWVVRAGDHVIDMSVKGRLQQFSFAMGR
jgi:F-type H+-transporting ATPase subunit delta